ncbi:TIGR00730 family Rossman fold protein [Sphingobacterium daejeonense]|jgi:uncharacterized protein (TIGR00730 family)|uniref:Cytokinin riboside 5'-monophosphate phosphoribohydrolase n=1 Tax=Sphingobacterium daejeonense TaxID=371142 RepID=A0ABW3RI51_9SPHI|nr:MULTISPECIES: TIGR00730 family Rossman fold protein [Sphingobacterium]MCT1531417.1 TIGR00730 family Rossman fold protein [Sphingobacterium daejeonense]
MSNKFVREEINFLKGARGRWNELKYAFGVVFQFMKGFRTLHFVGPCVTVFGSARFGEDHPYYIQAREISAKLAEQGFTIMTGGGPGIMEAANRGAKDVNGASVGCNIVLPHEQKHNPYMDKFVNIDYFFVRKELLRKYSFAFVIMPGGFGTLDEFFETLTLIQTKKISQFPIVVMGMDFHQNIKEHVDRMIIEKTISPEDQDLLLFTDDIQEAAAHILKYADTNKIIKLQDPKPSWILGEKKAI